MKIIRNNPQILLIILVSLFTSQLHSEGTQMVSLTNLWQNIALAAGGTLEHTYLWHTFYGYQDGIDHATGIAADYNGNSYLIAYSRASFYGDHGIPPLQPHGGGNIAYPESNQIMILKLNRNGAYQWHTFFCNANDAEGIGIALDGGDNVYVTG